MIEAVSLPIEKIEPASPNGPGYAGFMSYHSSHIPKSLVVDWSNNGYNFNLEGPHVNRFFRVGPDAHSNGFLIRAPDISVELESAFDPTSIGLTMGALVLKNGVAHLVGARLDDPFADEVLFPLWASMPQGSCTSSVGFHRWKLFVKVGNYETTLWQHSSAAADG